MEFWSVSQKIGKEIFIECYLLNVLKIYLRGPEAPRVNIKK